MHAKKPPLSTVEVQELETILEDPTTVENIRSEQSLVNKLSLTQKYFERTEDRKYAYLESVLVERLKFVQFANKDRHDRNNFAWQYMSHLETAYKTILDRKEDNSNKVLEAINKLPKYIKNGVITTLFRLNAFKKTQTNEKDKDTLLTYDTNTKNYIRQSLTQLTSTTKNKEDGYPTTKFTKHIYKLINNIIITPITPTSKEIGEPKPQNTDYHYTLGTLHMKYLKPTKTSTQEDLVCTLYTIIRGVQLDKMDKTEPLTTSNNTNSTKKRANTITKRQRRQKNSKEKTRTLYILQQLPIFERDRISM